VAYAELDPSASDCSKAVIVTTTWNEKPLIEQVPGSRWIDGAWRVPCTWNAMITLRGVFGPKFTYGPRITEWLWNERTTRVDPSLFLRDRTEWPTEWPNTAHPVFDPRLRPFQVVGATWLLTARDAVLGDDMRSGKTVQILSALRALGSPGLPAIVICPNGVKRHWEREIGVWYPEANPYVVSGSASVRNKILSDAKIDPSAIVIINIESARLFSRLAPYGSVKLKRCDKCDKRFGEKDLPPSRCEVHSKVLNSFGFRVGIIDEAHHIQNPKSKFTRSVWAIMHNPSIQYHWAASGTITGDHIGYIWPVMHAIARAEYPIKSKWMDRYALMSWSVGGGTDVIGIRPDTKDEMFQGFDPRFRRMSLDRIMPQLPPRVRVQRVVEMSSAQKRMYAELDKSLVTRTDDGELLIAPDNLTAKTRMMQITAASVKIIKGDPDDTTTWTLEMREPAPKLDELEAILTELGDRQCVVAMVLRSLIDLTSERLTKLGIKHGFLTGGQSEYERDQQLQLLRQKKIRVLLFTVAAGSEGIDMSCVDTMVVLQRSWRMIDDLQMERRIYPTMATRDKKMMEIIDVVTEDTVETHQLNRLYEKRERLEEINRDRLHVIASGGDTSDLDREEMSIINSDLGIA
jgi:SNF2 family DNA or RNA helicase